MKKILSLCLASTFILGSSHICVSAGSRMSHERTQDSSFSYEAPELPAERIAAIQADAINRLHSHDANIVDSSTVISIDRGVIDTAYYFDNATVGDGHYLYFPNVFGENVITTFIPASSFVNSKRSIGEFVGYVIARAANIGIHTTKSSLDEKINDVYEKISLRVNSNDIDPNRPLLGNTYAVTFCQLLNTLHLFDLLNDELQTLQTSGSNINDFGFLVIEITGNSPEGIKSPSTFHVTTIHR